MVEQEYPEYWVKLNEAIDALKADKPAERGEQARHYNVALTQLEIIRAYISVEVLNYNPPMDD